MGFKRARTDEQKRERLAGAVDAADRLLDRFPYREITMTSIADELGFSRANLGHYVRTKEELFLLLYLRDLTALHDELGALAGEDDGGAGGDGDGDGEGGEGAGDFDGGIEAFAVRFAAACGRHRNVGRVGALLTAIVETNVDVERLAACKREMMQLSLDSARLFARRFPFLSDEDAMNLVMDLVHYVAGLYPAAYPLEVQREAMRRAGFEQAERSFEQTLARFTAVQLNGYRALATG